MKTRRLLLLLLAAAAIAAFFVFDLGRYLSLDVLKAKQEALQAYASANPLQSAAIFPAPILKPCKITVKGARCARAPAGRPLTATLDRDSAAPVGARPGRDGRPAPLRRPPVCCG